MKNFDDQSLFAWTSNGDKGLQEPGLLSYCGLLAELPAQFADSRY
jgi:hypothetical protein